VAVSPSAAEVIGLLGLSRHPEGGWYRQTFADVREGQRALSTAIYYLLEAGDESAWHRVDAVEIWHWYAGAPLDLQIARDGAEAEAMTLGPDLVSGQRPQAIVPTGHWQSARSLGEWTLVGCTVAPGFEFSGFELAQRGWVPNGI
jgi:uncharacterized protein